MEPFNEDELSDQELDVLLREWKAPRAPARLRASIFPNASRPWWHRLWGVSIRIPLPAAISIAIVVALVVWRWSVSVAPLPVVKEPGVTRTAPGWSAQQLQPVAELRPIIIRSGE